jgi:DNA-binding NarL/FixJ family response regulator
MAQFPASSSILRAIRILVVDDHDIVREGLTALLQRTAGMSVVGYAANGEQAVSAVKALTPDVVVMDLMLPTLNGLDASRRILEEWPLTQIIALSSCHTSDHVHRALHAGARGYVTKTSVGADLIIAIKVVRSGQIFVSPGILPIPAAPRGILNYAGRSISHLSERERQVLRALVKGSSSSVIGRQLSLSPKSVDTYRHRIMVKLGVSNRAELIRLALEDALTVV